MQKPNRWLLAVLTAGLLAGSLPGSLKPLFAAPAPAQSVEIVRVNINKADTSELEKIRGIGPSLAQRIVEDREANGRFEELEDLIRVPGIGQAKFEKIKDQLTL